MVFEKSAALAVLNAVTASYALRDDYVFGLMPDASWSGSVAIEYSLDNEATWQPALTMSGVAAVFSAATPGVYSGRLVTGGRARVRARVSAYSAGSIVVNFGISP